MTPDRLAGRRHSTIGTGPWRTSPLILWRSAESPSPRPSSTRTTITGLNPLNQEGVDDSRQMSWGIDTGYVVSPNLTFAVSYYWGILYPDALQLHQRCPNISTWPSHRSALGSPTRQLYHRVARKLSDRDRRPGAYQNLYGTYELGGHSRQLNIVVRYTASLGVDQQATVTGAPTGCSNVSPIHFLM